MRLYLPGNPIALKRGRMANGRIYDSQKLEKKAVQWEMVIQRGDSLFKGPVAVKITFKLPAPVLLVNKLSKGKIEAFPPHSKKPDLDNLIKFYLDCMNGIIFFDDAQVYSLYAEKVYALESGTEIIIWGIDDEGVQRDFQ